MKLGVIPTLAPYLLPKLLPLVHDRYPDLAVKLRRQTKALIEELVAGDLDAVMLALPVPEADVEVMRLFEDPFLLAVPASGTAGTSASCSRARKKEWVQRWRRQAHGCVSIVRYADDFVMAFESEVDARKMLAGLTERLVKFGLALHEEKTRLIMFGKYAAERRQRLGKGRPETFDFLGFTHYCATSRDGKFIVKRQTQRKRKIRKLKELRIEARRRMHSPVAKQHEWLSAVLRGHFAYYGLPSNMRSMVGFAYEVRRLWLRVLARRSQRGMTWDRFKLGCP